ncbi:hypothetical protein AB835_13085 [Candidatus Endobugula sertula]|uniref:Outer membrane protein beta-barrel domain-containing protein n=1 Tax=Candidatus Endobugula sertula TaxID=62101 RepID=A0A1D2QM39_9GAMM|nr:hypothetical protein AB835_13085 [Candidatus Endobugula sertula]
MKSNFLVLHLELLIILFCQKAFSDEKDYIFSLNTGSYLNHIGSHNSEYVQRFDNKTVILGIKSSDSTSISVGSFLNSFNNHCFLLGIEKNWHHFNNKLSFEGLYAYAGEFFFNKFDNCGNNGVYNTAKDKLGIAAVPYIYHGFEYDFTSFMSLQVGIILPNLFVSTIQWKY